MRRVEFIPLLMLLAGCTEAVSTVSWDELAAAGPNVTERLELRQQPPALADDFAFWRWHDGQLRHRGGAEMIDTSCYFVGRIAGDPTSALVAKSCAPDRSDIEGVVVTTTAVFDIAYRNGAVALVPSRPGGRCGVSERQLGVTEPAGGSLRTTRHALSTGVPRFIETAVFRDEALLDAANQGYQTPDPVLAVQAAALLYDRTRFDERVLPILTAVVDVDEASFGAPPAFFGNEILVGPYLDQFNGWLDGNPAVPRFDQATLLSGWEMEGATVGLANVSGACSADKSGSLVYGIGSAASVTQTLAHELGHAIGMWHDGYNNACPQTGFVMTAVYDPDGPYATEFSSCSITDANAFLELATCIETEAQGAFVATCGDGKVEGDEQCDCGPAGCAERDPCCDGSTCQHIADRSACGTDQLCYEGACVDASTVPEPDPCEGETTDTDGDGVIDCDDACPEDASTSAEPCPEPAPDDPTPEDPPMDDESPPENPSAAEDSIVVLVDDDEAAGCTTVSSGGSWWVMAFMAAWGMRRGRKRPNRGGSGGAETRRRDNG